MKSKKWVERNYKCEWCWQPSPAPIHPRCLVMMKKAGYMKQTHPEYADTANEGFGVDPNPNCEDCLGRGFYYLLGWAKTCHCKKI